MKNLLNDMFVFAKIDSETNTIEIGFSVGKNTPRIYADTGFVKGVFSFNSGRSELIENRAPYHSILYEDYDIYFELTGDESFDGQRPID